MIQPYLPPMARDAPSRWLMLIHQLPHKPAYLRVKIGRRLARVGAVALKSSVYVLPKSEAAIEDFQWIRREIIEGTGDATLTEAQLLEGLSDGDVEALFRAARDEDFSKLTSAARELGKVIDDDDDDVPPSAFESEVARLEQRLSEIDAIDFFDAPLGEGARSLVALLRERLQPAVVRATEGSAGTKPRGATWVTRAGVHVDRIASAWLIRRFIDPDATFKFVAGQKYTPQPGELRFDMYDGEFTHEGDRCSFETLCARFEIKERGVQAISEMVHDLDLKDGKYERPETPGVASTLAGICLAERDDTGRVRRGSELFDALLLAFARRSNERARP
jgi:hypothetical protein